MNKSQKIEKFIMDAFDIYNFDYKEFFNYTVDNFDEIYDEDDFNFEDEDFEEDFMNLNGNDLDIKLPKKENCQKDHQDMTEPFEVSPANPFRIEDGYVNETFALPQVIGRSLVLPLLKRAAKILGVTPKALINMDKSEIWKWYEKYEFFSYKQAFDDAEKRGVIHEKDEIQKLMIAIFSNKIERVKPTRYDGVDIFKRLTKLLKEYDKKMPGAYHKNARIKGRAYISNFFHYKYIHGLVNSYIEMVCRAKELFEKAWNVDLNADEIQEYNFLACVLGIQDPVAQRFERAFYTIEDVAYQQDYLYYDILKQFIPLYKEQEKKHDFLSIVKFKETHKLKPWMCIEFLEDRELAQKYVKIFPEAKHEMRRFSMDASKFLCVYSWSDEEDNGEYLHKAYVPKTAEELRGEEEAVKNIRILSGPVKKGGLKINYEPVKVLNHIYMVSRTMAMLSVKGDHND